MKWIDIGFLKNKNLFTPVLSWQEEFNTEEGLLLVVAAKETKANIKSNTKNNKYDKKCARQ